MIQYLLEGLTVLPISRCAAVYAQSKVHFQKIGKPMHDEFDLIIGSTAVSAYLTLVTDNVKHFKNFPAIHIENWFNRPVGSA